MKTNFYFYFYFSSLENQMYISILNRNMIKKLNDNKLFLYLKSLYFIPFCTCRPCMRANLADMGSIWSIFLHKFESSLSIIVQYCIPISQRPLIIMTQISVFQKCQPWIFFLRNLAYIPLISLLIRTFKIDLFRHRLQNSDAGSTFPGSTFWEGFLQIIKLRNLILRHLMYYFHAQYM